jgi:hypothetical protein
MSITLTYFKKITLYSNARGEYGGDIESKLQMWIRGELSVGATDSMACAEVYLSPALCRECGKMGSSLYGTDVPACEFCQSTNIVSYDDPELKAASSDPPEEYIELTNGLYYCSQCKDFSLRFEDTGIIAC